MYDSSINLLVSYFIDGEFLMNGLMQGSGVMGDKREIMHVSLIIYKLEVKRIISLMKGLRI